MYRGALLLALIWPLPLRAALTFEKDVRPILKAHCFHCHGEEEERSGNLDVRLKRFLEQGGDSGPAILAGKPEESLLLELVRAGEMPQADKKLTPEEVSTIERWIAEGAATVRPEPEAIEGTFITPEERQWWSFRPITRPTVPAGAANPIDAFIRARLQQAGLAPSPPADAATLIRRASFDLV
ncbi:MAG: c-type cytochrome domain-containing protein, partial [Pirellulaceae bacterium]